MDEGRLEAQAVAYQMTVVIPKASIYSRADTTVDDITRCQFSILQMAHCWIILLDVPTFARIGNGLCVVLFSRSLLIDVNVKRPNIFSLIFKPNNAKAIYQSVGQPSHTAPSTMMSGHM